MHFFGQAMCCFIRGQVYVAQMYPTPCTSTELAHNLEYSAAAKVQWTRALGLFDELAEEKLVRLQTNTNTGGGYETRNQHCFYFLAGC